MKKLAIEKIITDKSIKDIPVGILFEFTDGINLITGNNETGKSSMLAFLRKGFFKKNDTEKGRIYFKITDDYLEEHYRADIDKKDCKLFSESGEPVLSDFIEKNINKKYFEQGFTIDLDDIMNIKKHDNILINTIKDPSNEKLAIITEKIRNEAGDILGKNNRPVQKTAEYLKQLKTENNKIKELYNIELNYNNSIEELQNIDEETDEINKQEKLFNINRQIEFFKDNLKKEIEQKNIISAEFNEKLINNQEKYANILQNSGKIEANIKIIIKNKEKLEALDKEIEFEIEHLKREYLIEVTEQIIESYRTDNNITRKIKSLLQKKVELEQEIGNIKTIKENLNDNILRLNQESYETEKYSNLFFILLIIATITVCTFSFYKNILSAGLISILVIIFVVHNKLQNNSKEKAKKDKKEIDISFNKEKLVNIENKEKVLKEEIKSIVNESETTIRQLNKELQIPFEFFIEITSAINKIKALINNKTEIKKTIEDAVNENSKLTQKCFSFIKETEIAFNFGNNYNDNMIFLKNLYNKNIELKNKIDIINSKIENINNNLKELEAEKLKYKDISIKFTTEDELLYKKQELLRRKKEAEYKKHDYEHFEGLSNLQINRQALLEKYRKNVYILAKNKVILELLKTAKERFDKIQPNLQSAQKFLEILTDGKYSKINIDMEEIQNTNGSIIKKWADLSKGTKEQVYFALRLGYALNYTRDKITQKYNGKPSLPLIIDDATVNFDEKRTAQAIKCLIEISKTNQVLFFTCHCENYKNIFKKLCNDAGITLNIINLCTSV